MFDDELVRINPPDDLDQMIESWLAYEGESVGYCFVCDSRASSTSFPGQTTIVANGRKPRADIVGQGAPAVSSQRHEISLIRSDLIKRWQGRAHLVARCACRLATVRRKKCAARRHEGLDALDVKVASFEGKITDQKAFADYGERRAYAELIVKLGGHFVPQTGLNHLDALF